jgi:hypothetical protein
MDRRASQVCRAGQADCGGLTCLFASVLRANGVPARMLVGRWAESEKAGDKLNGFDYHQTHVKAEFFAQGIGWVPVDLAGGLSDGADREFAHFGDDPGDFLAFQVDEDFVVNPLGAGREIIWGMQNVAYWYFGKGDGKDEVYKENWTVQRLPLPDGK